MYFWYLKQKLILLFLQYIFIQVYATPYRLERNANGGGILLDIREDIPSKLLNTDLGHGSWPGSFAALIILRKT